MPVGHNQLMVPWYLAKGTITDVFVMNFTTGIVSDVAPNKKPQSLGTVKGLKRGHHAIPENSATDVSQRVGEVS